MTTDKRRKVHGIGGVFFRSRDPAATRDWYARHLGLAIDEHGTNFAWRRADEPERKGHTQWTAFDHDTDYFGDPNQHCMINYRVEDLDGLLEDLRRKGVPIVSDIERAPYGTFVHILDNEGRRVELWEPNDEAYEKILGGVTK